MTAPLKKPYKQNYSLSKRENCRRIICLGTSAAEGHSLTYGEDAYPAVLEKKLNLYKKNFEVINAGLSRHETFRISIYFQDVLLKLNPDIVIAYLGANEHDDGAGLVYSLIYKRIKQIIKAYPKRGLRQGLLLTSLSLKYPTKVTVPVWNSLCKSYLFFGLTSLKTIFVRKLQKIFPEHLQNTGFKQSKLNDFSISADSFLNIVNACHKRGISLLLIPEIYSNAVFAYPRYAQMMQKVSNKADNIYFLDLHRTFRHQTELFYDDIHPKEEGHEIIADKIYNKLKEENLI